MSPVLAVLFFFTATLYAAVGFGGGSTYSALLVLTEIDYLLIPIIALTCNLIVVSGGVVRFQREGSLPARRLLPFLAASIPAAWIGGRLPISELVFVGLLGSALLFAGLRLLFQRSQADTDGSPKSLPLPISLGLGAGIGFLAGLVGIGGGIFLAPVLYFTRWGSPREIAGACSLFILANSLSGLTGQAMKLGDMELLGAAFAYWPLAIAVLIGGQIGSWLGSARLQPDWIKRLTAVLILYVAARLLVRFTGYIA